MIEKQYTLALRRLDFGGALEEEFRREHYRRSVPYIRFGFSLFLLVLWLQDIPRFTSPPPAGLEAAFQAHFLRWVLFMTPAFLAVLLAVSIPRLERLLQPFLVLAGSSVALDQCLNAYAAAALPGGDDYTRLLGFAFGTSVTLVGVYTAARLRFLYAAFAGWCIVGGIGITAAHAYHLTPGEFSAVAYAVLMLNFLGMFACYTMERSARADFIATHLLEREREKSERLLLNVLPGVVAERLKGQPGTLAESFPDVTVLFADLVDFTHLSTRMEPRAVVELLNDVFSAFDRLAEKHGLEKIKTIGDAYMLVGGVPTPRPDHAQAVAEMALEMRTTLGRIAAAKGLPLRMRIGINSGPVTAGVIGADKFIYDLWGDTVNVASRMETLGVPDGIQVTEATFQRLKERFEFDLREPVEVKGRGRMTPYLLVGGRS